MHKAFLKSCANHNFIPSYADDIMMNFVKYITVLQKTMCIKEPRQDSPPHVVKRHSLCLLM